MSTQTTEQEKVFSKTAIYSLWLFSCFCVALPFLVTTFPPITDLPQHLGQIHLFGRVLEGDPLYKFQWWTPYILFYIPLAALHLLFTPLVAAKINLILLGIATTSAVFFISLQRGRSLAVAVLATPIFFNASLYWGFLPFLTGFPFFLLLVHYSSLKENFENISHGITLFALLAFLYLSHALWLAVGLLWIGSHSLINLRSLRAYIIRGLACAPIALVALTWYSFLRETSFTSPTVWEVNILLRLHPQWWSHPSFGALRLPMAYIMLTFVIGWVALGFWQHRKELRQHIDLPLLLASLLFVIFSFVLPTQFQRTILFAQRWTPYAVIFLLLASPTPNLKYSIQTVFAVTPVLVYSIITALMWSLIEIDELRGLEDAIEATPESSHALGLDYIRGSELLGFTPYFQHFAYTQVLRSTTLNFSFAEMTPMPVVYTSEEHITWTRNLEWFPGETTTEDITQFDVLLIRSTLDHHAQFEASPLLEPLTDMNPWRLYRVNTAD